MIYNAQIAKHYKSYRPALHKVILETCLHSNAKYNLALDIGCGVGHSSLELLPYCHQIIGIDNSEEMLQLAPSHDKLNYEKSDLPELSHANDSIDLITFAGSLFYCKSQELLDECLRVLNKNGEILIYDFNIHLDNIIQSLLSTTIQSDYNHLINFDDLDTENLNKLKSDDFTVSIDIELSDLIQLLQADQILYKALVKKYDADNLEEKLKRTLQSTYSDGKVTVNAELFYTMYQVV